MKLFISSVILAVVLNKSCGAAIKNIANGNNCLLNNLAINNLVPVRCPSAANADIFANANYLPNNYANPILEPIAAPNVVANSILANEVIGNVPGIELTNIQFTPLLSDLPNLQLGDITVNGDLPIGGTIKVCGCIPVYGMINIDGVVPSAGTAVVAETFGNLIADGIPPCANQYLC